VRQEQAKAKDKSLTAKDKTSPQPHLKNPHFLSNQWGEVQGKAPERL
jgi:hypothetical protein